MRHVHAFGDDALGQLDAVGLIEAINSGRVGRTEVVEAAIARTEAVNPSLNGLAYEAFDRARAQAEAPPRAGFFSGVPTFIKDNVDVAGMPTMRGTDAWPPRPAEADSDFARIYLATGMTPLGKTQMSEYGFSASAEHPRLGAVRNPWNTDHTAGASSSGSGRVRRCWRGADCPCQRRRRLHSNSRVLQRTCRVEAVARPATPGQRSQPECRSALWPTGCSAARCATPRRFTVKPNVFGGCRNSRRSGT